MINLSLVKVTFNEIPEMVGLIEEEEDDCVSIEDEMEEKECKEVKDIFEDPSCFFASSF